MDQLLAMDDTLGNTRWALTDYQGTIRDWADSNGDLIDHIEYDAFGNITNETNPTATDYLLAGFTGRFYDQLTGLQWNLNRGYDPTTMARQCIRCNRRRGCVALKTSSPAAV